MDPNLEAFEKNERYLATRLFQHIHTIKDYSFSSGRVAYDTIINLKDGRTILGEIKVRNCYIKTYPSYILEVMKFKSLCKRLKENNYDLLYYINFYFNEKDGLKDFVVFNLSARITEWQETRPEVKLMWMNDVTYKSTMHKVQKEVILLSIDDKIDWQGTITIG